MEDRRPVARRLQRRSKRLPTASAPNPVGNPDTESAGDVGAVVKEEELAAPTHFTPWWRFSHLAVEPQTGVSGRVSLSDIRRRLEFPRPTILTPYRHAELLHQHELPDDPEWPTPTDTSHVRVLMDRLAPSQCVVAALVAAELVLPIWDAAANLHAQRTAPAEFAELVRRCLHDAAQHETLVEFLYRRRFQLGEADAEHITHPLESAECAGNAALMTAKAAVVVLGAIASTPILPLDIAAILAETRADDATPAADSASEPVVSRMGKSAVDATGSGGDVEMGDADADGRFEATMAVDFATDAVRYWFVERAGLIRHYPAPPESVFHAPIELRDGFLRRWWVLCRCRLAFFDAADAVLE